MHQEQSKSSRWFWTVIQSIAVLAPPIFVLGCGGDGNSIPGYVQSNLVADTSGGAPTTDPHLVNAWGIAVSPTGPFWVNDNGSGVATLYDGTGKPFPVGAPLVVTVPGPAGSSDGSAPTGMIFNSSSDFVVTQGASSAASVFVFATEDGTISGWNPTVSAAAAILTVDNSDSVAIYKGLALANNAAGNFLFAADFHNDRVDIFDRDFRPATLTGAFNDPTIPAGFAPFGIQTIGSSVYVTYAKQDDDAEDDVAGPGNGFVDAFDTDGHFRRRVASQGTLNSPWGVVLAPATFGQFSNALLVGNFGDGRINAFNASTGALMGQLANTLAMPITINGLWGLAFGNGATAGGTSTLFFTAGPNKEQNGLFGSLQAVNG